MRKIISPSAYIQGPGVLKDLAEHIGRMGTKPIVISGRKSWESVSRQVEDAFAKADCAWVLAINKGHCSDGEIEKIRRRVMEESCDAVVGLGGGRIIDTAKAVAHFCGLPLVVCPTSAATDAPCSALSVLYDDEGEYDRVVYLKKNPDMVLVDSAVVSAAPERLFVSGMGDALATYFEARAVRKSGKPNQAGGMPTEAAFALARECYDVLTRDGRQALAGMRNHRLTEAVESVIEASTYLSGLGFESGGLAAAHGVQNGLTAIEELRGSLHGERVAFCVLVQLVMERADRKEIEEVREFMKDVGLPLHLADLRLEDAAEEKIRRAAAKACEKGSNIYKEPVEITEERVAEAIMTVDKMAL